MIASRINKLLRNNHKAFNGDFNLIETSRKCAKYKMGK